MVDTWQLWIDGQWVAAEDQRTAESINPANGAVVGRIACGSARDAEKAVAAARRAFDATDWPTMRGADRRDILRDVARLIREHAMELAELECLDGGKLYKQATLMDVPAAAGTFDHFAGYASNLRGETFVVPESAFSCTVRTPVGVVAQMVPWNAPLMLAAWKLAPALAAGNTCVLKPSELASLPVLRLGKILEQAGVPRGVVNIVTGVGKEVPEHFVRSPDVDMISFTGRTETGKSIARDAASTVKRLSLELGGKSANIVFPDADLDAALGASLMAAFMNSGQVCVAGSRLLLHESIHEEFLRELVARTRRLRLGGGLDEVADIGPVISEDHRQAILGYVARGLEEGARLECGGGVPDAPELERGFFVEPTIFSRVSMDMTIAKEEIFGPVLSVLSFRTEEEAIALANATTYGLAGMVWTQDVKRAFRVSKAMQAGTVWVNTFAHPYDEAPFGGWKQSGYGRELGQAGFDEFTQLKHINVDLSPGAPLASGWFAV